MTTIVLSASDQLLNVVSKPKIASGDMNSVLLRVEFDSIWDRFTKSAVFFTTNNEEETYEMILADNECTIPHEVLEEAGILNIGIRGVDSDTNAVKTSTLVKYRIEEGAPSGSGTTEEPTPSVYHQILALSEETRDIVAESEQKIQNLNYASGSWTPQLGDSAPEVLTVEGRFVKVGNIVDLVCTLVGNFYGKGEKLKISGFYPTCGTPSSPWLTDGIMRTDAVDKTMTPTDKVELVYEGGQYYLQISNPVTSPTTGDCIILVKAEYTTDDVLDQSEGSVSSVNGKTGAVVLGAKDVGAVPQTGGEFTGPVKVQSSPGGGYSMLGQGFLTLSDDTEDNGVYMEFGGTADAPTLDLYGNANDNNVLLRHLAEPKVYSDAATKGYVDSLDTGGGLNDTAAALLINILRNGVYSTDQSANITALEVELAMDGGSGSGGSGGGEASAYTVVCTLGDATIDNNASAVAAGASYTATITANKGYELDTVTVLMGGVDVTADVYADGVITIESVTGSVVISVKTVEASDILYQISTPTTFDGTNVIDTKVKLLDEDKDWSIVIDLSIANPMSYQMASYIYRVFDSEPNNVIMGLTCYSNGARYSFGLNTGVAIGNTIWVGEKAGNTHKGVLTHTAGTTVAVANYYQTNVAGRSETGKDVEINASAYPQYDITVELGAIGDGGAVNVNDFKIYNRVLTDDEISAYLNA